MQSETIPIPRATSTQLNELKTALIAREKFASQKAVPSEDVDTNLLHKVQDVIRDPYLFPPAVTTSRGLHILTDADRQAIIDKIGAIDRNNPLAWTDVEKIVSTALINFETEELNTLAKMGELEKMLSEISASLEPEKKAGVDAQCSENLSADLNSGFADELIRGISSFDRYGQDMTDFLKCEREMAREINRLISSGGDQDEILRLSKEFLYQKTKISLQAKVFSTADLIGSQTDFERLNFLRSRMADKKSRTPRRWQEYVQLLNQYTSDMLSPLMPVNALLKAELKGQADRQTIDQINSAKNLAEPIIDFYRVYNTLKTAESYPCSRDERHYLKLKILHAFAGQKLIPAETALDIAQGKYEINLDELIRSALVDSSADEGTSAGDYASQVARKANRSLRYIILTAYVLGHTLSLPPEAYQRLPKQVAALTQQISKELEKSLNKPQIKTPEPTPPIDLSRLQKTPTPTAALNPSEIEIPQATPPPAESPSDITLSKENLSWNYSQDDSGSTGLTPEQFGSIDGLKKQSAVIDWQIEEQKEGSSDYLITRVAPFYDSNWNEFSGEYARDDYLQINSNIGNNPDQAAIELFAKRKSVSGDIISVPMNWGYHISHVLAELIDVKTGNVIKVIPVRVGISSLQESFLIPEADDISYDQDQEVRIRVGIDQGSVGAFDINALYEDKDAGLMDRSVLPQDLNNLIDTLNARDGLTDVEKLKLLKEWFTDNFTYSLDEKYFRYYLTGQPDTSTFFRRLFGTGSDSDPFYKTDKNFARKAFCETANSAYAAVARLLNLKEGQVIMVSGYLNNGMFSGNKITLTEGQLHAWAVYVNNEGGMNTLDATPTKIDVATKEALDEIRKNLDITQGGEGDAGFTEGWKYEMKERLDDIREKLDQTEDALNEELKTKVNEEIENMREKLDFMENEAINTEAWPEDLKTKLKNAIEDIRKNLDQTEDSLTEEMKVQVKDQYEDIRRNLDIMDSDLDIVRFTNEKIPGEGRNTEKMKGQVIDFYEDIRTKKKILIEGKNIGTSPSESIKVTVETDPHYREDRASPSVFSLTEQPSVSERIVGMSNEQTGEMQVNSWYLNYPSHLNDLYSAYSAADLYFDPGFYNFIPVETSSTMDSWGWSDSQHDSKKYELFWETGNIEDFSDYENFTSSFPNLIISDDFYQKYPEFKDEAPEDFAPEFRAVVKPDGNTIALPSLGQISPRSVVVERLVKDEQGNIYRERLPLTSLDRSQSSDKYTYLLVIDAPPENLEGSLLEVSYKSLPLTLGTVYPLYLSKESAANKFKSIIPREAFGKEFAAFLTALDGAKSYRDIYDQGFTEFVDKILEGGPTIDEIINNDRTKIYLVEYYIKENFDITWNKEWRNLYKGREADLEEYVRRAVKYGKLDPETAISLAVMAARTLKSTQGDFNLPIVIQSGYYFGQPNQNLFQQNLYDQEGIQITGNQDFILSPVEKTIQPLLYEYYSEYTDAFGNEHSAGFYPVVDSTQIILESIYGLDKLSSDTAARTMIDMVDPEILSETPEVAEWIMGNVLPSFDRYSLMAKEWMELRFYNWLEHDPHKKLELTTALIELALIEHSLRRKRNWWVNLPKGAYKNVLEETAVELGLNKENELFRDASDFYDMVLSKNYSRHEEVRKWQQYFAVLKYEKSRRKVDGRVTPFPNEGFFSPIGEFKDSSNKRGTVKRQFQEWRQSSKQKHEILDIAAADSDRSQWDRGSQIFARRLLREVFHEPYVQRALTMNSRKLMRLAELGISNLYAQLSGYIPNIRYNTYFNHLNSKILSNKEISRLANTDPATFIVKASDAFKSLVLYEYIEYQQIVERSKTRQGRSTAKSKLPFIKDIDKFESSLTSDQKLQLETICRVLAEEVALPYCALIEQELDEVRQYHKDRQKENSIRRHLKKLKKKNKSN